MEDKHARGAGALLFLVGLIFFALAYLEEALYFSLAYATLAVIMVVVGVFLLTRKTEEKKREEIYSSAPAQLKTCPHCEKEVMGMGKFCGHCGSLLKDSKED